MKKVQWRWIFFICCILLGLALLFYVRTILTPFLAAFILAYLLTPTVDWLEHHHVSRNLSIAIIFLGILSGIALTIFLILPVLYNELSKIVLILPKTMASLEQKIQAFRAQFRSAGLPEHIVLILDQHLSQGEGLLAKMLQGFLNNLPETLASLSLFILSPILAIYFLADWKKITRGFNRLVEHRQRMEWQRIWRDINHVIRRFVRGNLIVAVIVGVLSGVGVKIAGMDYALLIGLICGVSDLIPYFGPLIGAIPSVMLGLTKSPTMALKVAVIILIVQQLEGNIISPKLMGDSVGLHPLLIVFALLAGGELAGFWGILFAVPVAAVLRVVIRHFYLRLVSPEV